MPKIQSYYDDEKPAGLCAIRKRRNVIRNITSAPEHNMQTLRNSIFLFGNQPRAGEERS
jgi:hypothetical protein